MEKTVLFAFRGDPMCFVHVLLNGLDLHQRGQEGLIVIEGEAVTLVSRMAEPGHFLNALYLKARAAGILHGACRACSVKLKADAAIAEQGIAFLDDMSGHPSMAGFFEKGYTVITF